MGGRNGMWLSERPRGAVTTRAVRRQTEAGEDVMAAWSSIEIPSLDSEIKCRFHHAGNDDHVQERGRSQPVNSPPQQGLGDTGADEGVLASTVRAPVQNKSLPGNNWLSSASSSSLSSGGSSAETGAPPRSVPSEGLRWLSGSRDCEPPLKADRPPACDEFGEY